MISQHSTFRMICAHAAFCVTVVLFFGQNSILRMAACDALYKEYVTGGLVLCLFYLEYFVLFPQLYLKNLKISYLVAGFASSFLFAGGELAYVGPHIRTALAATMQPDILRETMCHYLLFIFLRDAGFVLFAHLICDVRQHTRLKDMYESRLRETAQEIQIPINDTRFTSLKVDSILFCQQAKNTTWIYSEEKNVSFLYGSLKKLAETIGIKDIVFVKRDLFVNRNKILAFNEKEVTIRNEKNDEVKSFDWSSEFYEKALPTFQSEQALNSNDEKKTVSDKLTSQLHKNNKHLGGSYNQSRSIRFVYKYITQHPNCKEHEITKKLKVSSATTNRILKLLKDEGLIEYVGSKKTGGYRVRN